MAISEEMVPADRYWVAEVMGWMTVLDPGSRADALADAKSMARSASLLPSDVTSQHLRPATEADIEWFKAQGRTL